MPSPTPGRPASGARTGSHASAPEEQDHVDLHKGGTVRARGRMRAGVPNGHWEWFRIDGTRLRSGRFEEGRQVGEWTTYDQRGEVYKVTTFKS